MASPFSFQEGSTWNNFIILRFSFLAVSALFLLSDIGDHMKRLLPLLLLFFPVISHAAWSAKTSSNSSSTFTEADVYDRLLQSVNGDWPYYIKKGGANTYGGNKYTLYYDPDGDGGIPDGETVYNATYTDEQCSALYAGTYSVSFPVSASDTTFVSAGACALYQVPDENGIGSVCSNPDSETQSCFGDWDSVSTGNVNTMDFGAIEDAAASDTDLDQVDYTDSDDLQSSDDVPDYLTQTDDPSSCANGSMTAGGVSYCVDTSSVTVTDFSGSAWTGGGSGDGDSEGEGEGDGSGDGEGDGSGDGADGSGDGEGSCAEGQTCTTVNIPSGYETESTVESVMASFQTQLDEAPIMNMMPNLPSGSTASCSPISFSIGWIINGSFELDYCSWLINSGVLGIITSICMFGYCLAGFRIVMGA